ncbi:MAG: ADP-forming succinate--CoA ligase subunit beta [Gammaproteobacteria bacterium]|jgi:succinyl-CoA synthetase beta subunit|uniref:Succinate--CoA ligase [ADP-forming] subunit beta n=1 Tax=SAR86 cluster bacterium TaxID=2030880 RepID=A0A368BPX3_9GAMM|nr:ADP-forming succinate--CoA ligase subunit beta [Gammaproteobacteria bacterium]RCL39135.1 MAG: ADP-forming succinate--CoA ligase subunit beta [SAR86 cluster bacterium]|tara:strand:- start:507 stop:1667 length:1161 start_codon:yes stop_codon:yes gene_type:complete
MNLHEYQGKQLFAKFGLPVSKNVVISSADEALNACRDIGGNKWVVKAQVHAGGRGKAGGVKLVSTPEEAEEFANHWLGKRLVTYQTDSDGQLVNSILVEECTDIGKELYLSAVIDRGTQRVVFIGSSEGGVNIEEVAKKTPEKIIYEPIDPLTGPMGYQSRKISKVLGLNSDQSKQFSIMLPQLTNLFMSNDLSLLEINPLVITQGGKLHCLDAKINIDSNAVYRQPDIQKMHDPSQEDPREAEAAKSDLSYVSLDGNIGCMVNGAGLAMGTMDTIKFFGGSPANFLDVGGTATQERVSKAFKLILADPEVKVVLVNIFGGIVRCDLIAEGILAAIEEVGVSIPVVVRLEGNNADIGSKILANSNAAIVSLNNLEEAAKKAVELSK